MIASDVIGEYPVSTIMLHGGSSDRTRFIGLRKYLLEQGKGSVSFDFIGHGETGGELLGSTLHSRTDQTLQVIRERKMQEPLNIVGVSMSGYTAIKLTELVQVQNLILIVPAVYDAAAYDIPFGEKFSEVIRASGSWEKSDAWSILESFQGNLLVVAGDKDEVIPREVIDRIMVSSTSAHKKELRTLKDVPHAIFRHMDSHPEEGELFFRAIDRLIPPAI